MKNLAEKIRMHEAFWRGGGPCLLLTPTARMDQYDLVGYRERFERPELMWEAEMRRARPVLDWPTDGIPTVRPNLGVIFIPAIAGAGYHVPEGAMPWPGDPLTREAIRAIRQRNIANAPLMRLAREFYTIHAARGGTEIAAYHPDTQGSSTSRICWRARTFFCNSMTSRTGSTN